MRTKQSRHKGFASLDALASLIPILLMLLILWQVCFSFVEGSRTTMERQQMFNKLVSIADYTVKSGAVMRAGSLRYPNWLDEGLLSGDYSESLKEEAGLEELYIGMEEPPDRSMCIYRLVVGGPDKTIKKLFVCGG